MVLPTHAEYARPLPSMSAQNSEEQHGEGTLSVHFLAECMDFNAENAHIRQSRRVSVPVLDPPRKIMDLLVLLPLP